MLTLFISHSYTASQFKSVATETASMDTAAVLTEQIQRYTSVANSTHSDSQFFKALMKHGKKSISNFHALPIGNSQHSRSRSIKNTTRNCRNPGLHLKLRIQLHFSIHWLFLPAYWQLHRNELQLYSVLIKHSLLQPALPHPTI